jgi:hypothetical protein
MKLFTIGFTKKSAEEFFTHLQNADVTRIVDIKTTKLGTATYCFFSSFFSLVHVSPA